MGEINCSLDKSITDGYQQTRKLTLVQNNNSNSEKNFSNEEKKRQLKKGIIQHVVYDNRYFTIIVKEEKKPEINNELAIMYEYSDSNALEGQIISEPTLTTALTSNRINTNIEMGDMSTAIDIQDESLHSATDDNENELIQNTLQLMDTTRENTLSNMTRKFN